MHQQLWYLIIVGAKLKLQVVNNYLQLNIELSKAEPSSKQVLHFEFIHQNVWACPPISQQASIKFWGGFHKQSSLIRWINEGVEITHIQIKHHVQNYFYTLNSYKFLNLFTYITVSIYKVLGQIPQAELSHLVDRWGGRNHTCSAQTSPCSKWIIHFEFMHQNFWTCSLH